MSLMSQNDRGFAGILLAEENLTDVRLIREALNHSRYPVHIGVVSSGEEALGYLHHEGKHLEEAETDLLVLDLDLPGKQSWKLLEAVKKDPLLSHLHVLLVTSVWSWKDEAKAHELKADQYLVKPMDMAHFPMLIQAVDRILAA